MAEFLGEGRFIYKRLCKPPKPDAYCTLDGESLYVEVLHIYGTEVDARISLGRSGEHAPSKKDLRRAGSIPLAVNYITTLNAKLAKKATRKYDSERVWLLVRSGSILWNRTYFEEHQSAIVIPENHLFEEIWLVCGPTVGYGCLRLA
jgi:hypothetical protein